MNTPSHYELTKLYKDNAYPSKTAFKQLAIANGYTAKQAIEYTYGKDEQEVFAIVKKPQGTYNYDSYDIALIADLMDMQRYRSVNKQYKYILTIIEGHSRYAWAFPLKTKKPDEIAPKILEVIIGLKDIKYWKDKKVPMELLMIRFITDDGGEFKGSVSSMLHEYTNISRLIAIPKKRRSTTLVERFNGTILSSLNRVFVANGNEIWIDVLKSIIHTYNNRVHSMTKLKPIVALNNGSPLIIDLDNVPKREFKEGDRVRIILTADTFEKLGTRMRLSLHVYKVVKYMPQGKVVIVNNLIEQTVLESELTAVKSKEKTNKDVTTVDIDDATRTLTKAIRKRTIENRIVKAAHKEIDVNHEGLLDMNGVPQLKARLLPKNKKRTN